MSNKINDGLNAKIRYAKKMKKVQIELNTDKDSDIILKLNQVESKQGYIKNLIREDMSKEKK